MKNIRISIAKLTAKKVPALALVVVALVGAVAGVLAASIVISQSNLNGEQGNLHTNSGVWTITDNGLAVVSTGAAGNATSAVALGSTNVLLSNALTQGHWMDLVTFNIGGTPPSSTFTAKITFYQSNGSPQGTPLATVTSGTWTTTVSSTGSINFYVDLGASPLASPITAYVTVT